MRGLALRSHQRSHYVPNKVIKKVALRSEQGDKEQQAIKHRCRSESNTKDSRTSMPGARAMLPARMQAMADLLAIECSCRPRDAVEPVTLIDVTSQTADPGRKSKQLQAQSGPFAYRNSNRRCREWSKPMSLKLAA